MSSVLRSVKNVTKGYSAVQVKVRNATSNDHWGPTGADMAEIARITYNSSTDFYEVMDMLDKRLNDKGKNWRHVLKSLKVLDYCLHEGAETVVTWARKNIYIIKTLREFIYLDEEGRDVGAAIRSSAKELTSLILDEERLRAERANRGQWKSRVTGLEEFGALQPPPQSINYDDSASRRKERRRPRNDEDDLEYRLALEASKNEAEADALRRSRLQGGDDDDDLQKAIKLSKEEEELRKRELEDQQNQGDLLFDDTPTEQYPQPTGWNQGYQQQPAVDWAGNPLQQQQTGFLNSAYSQPTGNQAFQNSFGSYNQPQQTGWDQLQQPQQQFVQPQNTYNPWQQQLSQNGFQQQSQPQPQEQPLAQAGSNNPWASSNLQASTSIQPQPTGSNNPFATQRPATSHVQKAPTLATLQEQQASAQFAPRPNPITNYQPSVSAPSVARTTPQQQSPPAQQQPLDPHHARLNALLSSGEGQDTFGNTGDLRIPAQHTAPGTYINSYGTGSLGQLEAARTGTNPFFTKQTAHQVQYPAQTGPAGGAFGNNPFGTTAPQQQPSQNPGGSLIDL